VGLAQWTILVVLEPVSYAFFVVVMFTVAREDSDSAALAKAIEADAAFFTGV
jgi:hypothetical protein